VRELIGWLQARVPSQCEFVYRPRYFKDFQVLYRGMRCINPFVQRKQIRLMIKYQGWAQGYLITPETNLSDADFRDYFETHFARTCAEIDAALDGTG
jgi:hypothetical protein